jgi:hypothetical protein
MSSSVGTHGFSWSSSPSSAMPLINASAVCAHLRHYVVGAAKAMWKALQDWINKNLDLNEVS